MSSRGVPEAGLPGELPAVMTGMTVPWRGRLARLHPYDDVALAAAVAVLDMTTQWAPGQQPALLADLQPSPPVLLLAVAGYVPLAWRRRAPLAVFAAVWLHSVAAHLLVSGYRPTLSVLLALYTVAAVCRPARSVPALAAAFVVSGLSLVAELADVPSSLRAATLWGGIPLFALLDLVTWGVGVWVGRTRQDRADLLARRDRAAREAVTAERDRIARELHDIVAHAVTIMVVQAAGARRVLPRDPRQAEGALTNIEETGKQAMIELRRLLRVLGQQPGQPEGSTRTPNPGLGEVDELVDRMRKAGLDVAVRRMGTPGRLDPSVDLAAHRIVQEALTNVLKHAGPGAHAAVELHWDDSTLLLSIQDDGRGESPAARATLSTGHGLLGVNERARAVGGGLAAGIRPGGGFEVRASLPAAPMPMPMPMPAPYAGEAGRQPSSPDAVKAEPG
ncbi:sensor histidine kinase [Blastococcus deserti]|uniref:histidine kinase n=1 Tax=Blastococcus deserti TaxID=2259033 RepID=A0ABW4XHZ3_9ACTN